MQDLETKDTYGLELLKGLDRETVIYGLVRSISASGMTRNISLKIIKDGRLLDITYYAGEILGKRVRDFDGFNVLSIKGIGMDMVFHTVYNLASVLHGDGYYFRSEIL